MDYSYYLEINFYFNSNRSFEITFQLHIYYWRLTLTVFINKMIFFILTVTWVLKSHFGYISILKTHVNVFINKKEEKKAWNISRWIIHIWKLIFILIVTWVLKSHSSFIYIEDSCINKKKWKTWNISQLIIHS